MRDDDLGQRASDGTRRVGCKQCLAAVALGEGGMVLSTAASRLARTEKDWCHGLAICTVCRTFSGDAAPIDEVHLTADQWMLGMKGTLSVMALRVLQSRLCQGQEHKAPRGERSTRVASGSICADGTSLGKDPHGRVQEAIALVLRQLRALWRVRQGFTWCHEEGMALPVHKSGHGQTQLGWPLPTSHAITYRLTNPVDAGVSGPRQRQTIWGLADANTLRTKRVPQRHEHARVCIPHHHEPSISGERYAQHPQRSAAHAHRLAPQDAAVAAVRQGEGLLTGLRRCGRCGRTLQGRSWGASGPAARSLCRGDLSAGGPDWLGCGGATGAKQRSAQGLESSSPLA